MLFVHRFSTSTTLRGVFIRVAAEPQARMSGSSPAIVAALGGIATAYIFLWALLHLTHDSQEPSLLSTSIPFVGPILGMIRWSKEFYAHMR